jgi:hypothetical protein
MRIFIQLDDLYLLNPNILEPLLLDLMAIGVSDPVQQIEKQHTIYLVSLLPKPSDTIKAEWVHPSQVALLIAESNSNALIHFGPVAAWAKNIPNFFIPLTLPHEVKQKGWMKTWLENKRYHKTLQAAKQVVALDEWHAQYRAGSMRVALDKAPLPSFEWSQLAPIRSSLTDGNQYLLAFVDTEEIIPIVKAFSVFKKWQLSTMSIVFVMDSEEAKQKAAALLLGYKFRDAVELVALASFKLEWIAAAYLTIFSKMNSHRFQFLTYSMRYQIPFLMHQEKSGPDFVLPEMAAAGEYFDFKAPDVLANHFKLYYKDEMYRAAKGVEIEKAIQSEMLRFKQAATSVWPRDLH